MSPRCFVITAALLLLPLSVVRGRNTLSFHDEYPLVRSDNTRGSAVLTLAPTTFKVKEKVLIDLCFTNTGIGRAFFNPFFNPLLRPAAVIMIYDAEGDLVGEFLSPRADSERPPGLQDWVFVGARGYVGARFNAAPRSTATRHHLPIGRYRAQAVYFNGFVDFRRNELPADDLASARKAYESFDGREAFRSNAVEFTVVEDDPTEREAVGDK